MPRGRPVEGSVTWSTWDQFCSISKAIDAGRLRGGRGERRGSIEGAAWIVEVKDKGRCVAGRDKGQCAGRGRAQRMGGGEVRQGRLAG